MINKKKYEKPSLEIVLFESEGDMMDVGLSTVEPGPGLPSRMNNFSAYLKDLPNGTILNPEDYE